MPRPARRSRRTRNEPPEIVPKSEDEPDDEQENNDDEKVEPESDAKVEKRSTRRSTRARKPKTRSAGSNSAATRGQKKKQTAASSDDQRSKDEDDDDDEKKSDSSDDETNKNSKAKDETLENLEVSRDDDMSMESDADGEKSATPSKPSQHTKDLPKGDSPIRKSRRTPNKKSKPTEKGPENEQSDQDEEKGDDGSGDDKQTGDSPPGNQKDPAHDKQGAENTMAKEEEAANEEESEDKKRSSHSDDDENSATPSKKSQSSTKGLKPSTLTVRKSRRRANKANTNDHSKPTTKKQGRQSSDQEIKDDERSGDEDEASDSEDGDESATPSKASQSNKPLHTKAAGDSDDDGDESSSPSKASLSIKQSEKPAGGSRKSRRRMGKKTEEEEVEEDGTSGGVRGQNQTKATLDSEDDGDESSTPSKVSQSSRRSEKPAGGSQRSRKRTGKKTDEEGEDRQSGSVEGKNETKVDSDDDGEESASPSKASRSTKGSEQPISTPRRSRRRVGKKKKEEDGQSSGEDVRNGANVDSDDGGDSTTPSKASRSTKGSEKPAGGGTRKSRRRRRGKMLEEIKEEVDEEEEEEERQSGDEDEQSKSKASVDKTALPKAGTEGRRTKAYKNEEVQEPTRKNRKRPRAESTPLPRADAIKTETLSDENLSSEGENESDGVSSADSVASVTSKNKDDVNSHVSGGSRESTNKTRISDGPKEEKSTKTSGEADSNKASEDNEIDGASKLNRDSEGGGSQAESKSMMMSEEPETGTTTDLQQDGGSVKNAGQASSALGGQDVGEVNENAESDLGQRKDGAAAGDHDIGLKNSVTGVAPPSEQIKNAADEEGSSSLIIDKKSHGADTTAKKPVDLTSESSANLPPTGTPTNQTIVDKTNDAMPNETSLQLDKKTTEPEPDSSIIKRAMPDEKGTIQKASDNGTQRIEDDDEAEESRPTKRTRTVVDDAAEGPSEDTNSQEENRPEAGATIVLESSKSVDETAESRPAKRPRDGTADVEDGEKEMMVENPNEVQAQPRKSSNEVREQIDAKEKPGLEGKNNEGTQSGGDSDKREETRPAKRSRVTTDESEVTKMSTEASDVLGGGSEKPPKGNPCEANDKLQEKAAESDTKFQVESEENMEESESPGIGQSEPSMAEPSDRPNEAVMQKTQREEVTTEKAAMTKEQQNESDAKETGRSSMVDTSVEPVATAPPQTPPASGLLRPKDGDVATKDGGSNADSGLTNKEEKEERAGSSVHGTKQSNEVDSKEKISLPVDKQQKETIPKPEADIESGTDQQPAPFDAEVPESNPEDPPVGSGDKLQQIDKPTVQQAAEPTKIDAEKLNPTDVKDTTHSSPLNLNAGAPKMTSPSPDSHSLEPNTALEGPDNNDDVKVVVTEHSSQDTKKEENQLEENNEFVDAAEKQVPHEDERDSGAVLSTPIESSKDAPEEMEKVGTSSADQAPCEEKQDTDEKPSQGGVQSFSNEDLDNSPSLQQDAPAHNESVDALKNPPNATVEGSEDDIEEFHDAHMEFPPDNESPASPKTTGDASGLTEQCTEKHGVVSTSLDTGKMEPASSIPVSKEDQGNEAEKPEAATAEIADNVIGHEASVSPGPANDEGHAAAEEDEDTTPERKVNSSTPNETGTEPVVASSSDSVVEKDDPTKVTSGARIDMAVDPISSNLAVKKIDSTSVRIRSAPEKPKTMKISGYQHDGIKLSRVKTLLYSTGSRVHRGRGFERIFAEYWDAIMLRLSDRLSSHTSESCERPIKAFLRSSRLRKLHNQFIRCIMKRATSTIAPYSEVASHMPRKWICRVPKVVKDLPDTSAATDSQPSKKIVSDLIDGKACFSEAWVHDMSGEGEIPRPEVIVPKASGGRERESSCIPGALVVDPLIRAAAGARGMQVSENAVWLLVVGVKEYISSLLKHSISHNESYEQGSIMTPGSYFGNTLIIQTDAAKKDPSVVKVGEKDKSNSSGQGQKNRSLSSLDILMGSMQVGGSSMNTLGGSASRFALERCLQSAFVPVGLPPEDDFAHIQNFFVEEITSFAQKRHIEAQSKPAAKAESSTEQKNPGRVEHERKLQSDFQPADPKDESKGEPNASNVSNAENPKAIQHTNVLKPAVPTQAGQPPRATVAASTPVNDAAASTSVVQPASASDEPDELKQGGASGPRGLGRGAKNLAALLKRAETTQEDASETAAEQMKKGEGGTSNPDRGQANSANASRSAVQAGPPAQSPKDMAEPSQPARAEGEDNEDAPARRGKGFGIKNLAAMKARTTTKPDGTS